MLHMPFEAEGLLAKIREISPSWLERARKQSELNRTARKFVSMAPLWSEIKQIFVVHQRHKCAYCERRLGTSGIEWDVEHFRPKGKVTAWSSPDLTTGGADPNGYFGLAFEPRNYLVACKPCNSIHKRNFFPVASQRRMEAADVDEARSEQPYLLNPLDPDEQPPEQLIDFHGVNPRLASTEPTGRNRAQLTIEVIGLDRSDLDFERAQTIMNLWNALRLGESGRANAAQAVTAMTGPGAAHANCARCFQRLFSGDRVAADSIGELATDFVSQHSR